MWIKEQRNMERHKKKHVTGKAKIFLILILAVILVCTACQNEDTEVDNNQTASAGADLSQGDEAGDLETVEVLEDETTENPEEITENITPAERIQPDGSYSNSGEFFDFVDSLELEETVVLYYWTDENIIIYDGDTFIMPQSLAGTGFFVYSYKEISNVIFDDAIFNAKDINNETLLDNYTYVFIVNRNIERDLEIKIEYTDGTEDEMSFHIIPSSHVELIDYVDSLEHSQPGFIICTNEDGIFYPQPILEDGEPYNFDFDSDYIFLYIPGDTLEVSNLEISVPGIENPEYPYSVEGKNIIFIDWYSYTYWDNSGKMVTPSELPVRIEYTDGSVNEITLNIE